MHNDSHSSVAHFNQILEEGLLGDEDNNFILYDFNVLNAQLQKAKLAFGETFKHYVAVKTNPLGAVLEHIVSKGFGLECASFEEVILAHSCGAQAIGWDSPAKTDNELRESDKLEGLLINANSLNEAERAIALNQTASIFLRINSEVDTGTHESMSVSGAFSKFGEPISNRAEIIDFVLSNKRITGLHIHASSQTVDYAKTVEAIKSVVSLADEINSHSPNTIRTINIGGGFPVNYHKGDEYDIQAYADQLKVACPGLFDGTYSACTEFGRYYHAYAGSTYSRIEDVKVFENKQVVILNIGADSFVREAYNQGVWYHEIIPIQQDTSASNKTLSTDFAGPLCFGGDFIAKNHTFPVTARNNWVCIKDTGANTFSLWSRHCSRRFPMVIGYNNAYTILKEKEGIDQIVNFWK